MTNAQIAMAQHQEQVRANKAKEYENTRSNKAKENETYRSNKAKERLERESQKLTKRGQNLNFAGNAVGSVTRTVGTIAGIANDPKFYTKDNEYLIKSSVPTNFNVPLGLPTIEGVDDTIPGITAITIQNAPGVAHGTVNDPVNKMASMLFTAIQAHTNYTKSYQQVDLLMCIMAMREIVGLLHHSAKILRIAKTYSKSNEYYSHLMKALNIDATDLRTNYANYIKELHLLALEASQLYIPRIPLFDRTAQIYGSWFRENCVSPEDLNMSYVFKPFTFGVFDLDTSDSTGFIHYFPISYFTDPEGQPINVVDNDDVMPFSYLLKALQFAINSIISDDNFKLISGDIARTFKEFFIAEEIDTDSFQVPAYDELSLAQIHNIQLPMVGGGGNRVASEAYAPGSLYSFADLGLKGGTFDITQSDSGNGLVIWEPVLIVPGRADTYTELVRDKFPEFSNILRGIEVECPYTSPTTDYIIDATRLAPGYTVSANKETDALELEVYTCGVEIPISYTVFQKIDGDAGFLYGYHLCTHSLDQSAISWGYSADDYIAGSVYLINSPNGITLRNFQALDEEKHGCKFKMSRSGNVRNTRFFDGLTSSFMNRAAAMSLFGITSLFKELLSINNK